MLTFSQHKPVQLQDFSRHLQYAQDFQDQLKSPNNDQQHGIYQQHELRQQVGFSVLFPSVARIFRPSA